MVSGHCDTESLKWALQGFVEHGGIKVYIQLLLHAYSSSMASVVSTVLVIMEHLIEGAMCMQVVVEVLGKCLKSECLLMWSAEDTFDTGEGCMRTFHILEVLGSTDGVEASQCIAPTFLCLICLTHLSQACPHACIQKVSILKPSYHIKLDSTAVITLPWWRRARWSLLGLAGL